MIQSFQERAPRDIPIKIPRSGFFSWPLKWCGYFCSGVTFLPTIFSWSVKLHTCRITPDLLMFKAQRMIQLFAYCTIWYTIPYNGPIAKTKKPFRMSATWCWHYILTISFSLKYNSNVSNDFNSFYSPQYNGCHSICVTSTCFSGQTQLIL